MILFYVFFFLFFCQKVSASDDEMERKLRERALLSMSKAQAARESDIADKDNRDSS